MKNILGLDLGTNSIGWALIEIDHKKEIVKILGLGSRIIPMNTRDINDYKNGKPVISPAANRTEKRGPRRLNERYILRRDRLQLVLNLLDALPPHYKLEIDREKNGKRSGQLKKDKEPKLAYKPINSNKYDFIFKDSYNEMLKDINSSEVKNEKGKRIPYDWTLYYLRQKALTEKITLEELAWVLLSYNQKRGYQKTEVEEQNIATDKIVESFDLKVKNVEEKYKNNKKYFEITLNDGTVYNEESKKPLTKIGDIKEIIKVSKIDEKGFIIENSTEFTITDIYFLKIEEVKYEKVDDGFPHRNKIIFSNGWSETKKSKNYTYKYSKIKGKEFEYIVTSVYKKDGTLKERKFKDPDYSEGSSDWTLLKKKTEKEALGFNSNYYINEDGNVKKYISPLIYETLKNDAQQGKFHRTKIIGGKFQVIDREFYREELKDIINAQKQFHNTLNDENKEIFEKCVKLLYPQNDGHKKNLLKNNEALTHLLVDDILLYQRPLKSKKSEIGNCKFEIRRIVEKENIDKETGEIKKEKIKYYHKVVPVSHPLFQEFRIWDKIHNLKLIRLEQKQNNGIETNIDVTKQYFNERIYSELFEELNNRKGMNQKQFLNFCKNKFKIDTKNYVWNFPEDEEIKGNETRISFASRFKRCRFDDYEDFLTQEKEIKLWHYLYSVNYLERTKNNEASIKKFFNNFFKDYNIDKQILEKIIDDFSSYPKFASKYCAYSEKALKKLIPFIRLNDKQFKGKFDISKFEEDLKAINYQKSNILDYVNKDASLNNKQKEFKKQVLYYVLWQNSINNRVEEIIKRKKQVDFENIDFSEAVNLKTDVPYPKGLFNAFKEYEEIGDFTNLNLTQASYLVYGRHSELANEKHWTSPNQVREEINKELKHNSLNNPIAEKIIREMMQVVADIWELYGKSKEKYFSEIHIEVARDLKNNAKQKEKIWKAQSDNKKQNNRLRKILNEFLSENPYNAKPNNSEHFERLKILENSALQQLQYSKNKEHKKEIEKILKEPEISKQDFEKYKLWIEQGYKSPYTNKMIKISDLFDGELYNIDHVLPQALITNNSLSNKVVCETEVNKLKSDKTGRDFILNPSKNKIYCAAFKKDIEIINDEKYISTVKQQFSGTKSKIMLAKEIPSDFTNSQLSSTRHIARKAMELLSHIVREKGEIEFRSKNVLPVTGRVTSDLKQAWRFNEVWTELVAPRFKRMNELTNSDLFGKTQKTKNGKEYFDCKIDNSIKEKMEGYEIKRIDHRHHALDALIIALCTKEHVEYINNINADAKSNDYKKQAQIKKQRLTLKKKIKFSKPSKNKKNVKDWFLMLPGEIRKKGTKDSSIDTVLKKNYYYKSIDFNKNFKNMILTAMQDTIVTFKQNMRVINKNNNKYLKYNNNGVLEKINQKPESPTENSNNKYNWQIRRSLSEASYYARVDLGLTVNKQLHKSLKTIYSDTSIIKDSKLKLEIETIIKQSLNYKDFTTKITSKYPDKKIVLKDYKIAIRKPIDKKFNRDKIKSITDKVIQNILKNHLEKFDTIELPFEEALEYLDYTIEKEIFQAIVDDNGSDFSTINNLIQHLKTNNFKYKKEEYKNLNVFIEKVESRKFRDETDANGKAKYKIAEHPEEAFSPENLAEMNKLENLKQLNKGKNHHPIYKVRYYKGFGKQRKLSDNINSVKSNQYVVTDAGSNLYVGIYEREFIDENGEKAVERKFEDIRLPDLIELLKQDKEYRHNPLPLKIYDEKGNEYSHKFTLSPYNLVYVPTDEEIKTPSLVDFNNLSKEQTERIYVVNDFSTTIYFTPNRVAKNIAPKEVDLTFDNKKNKFTGSFDTKTASFEGKQIKDICWKLKANRLGQITGIER